MIRAKKAGQILALLVCLGCLLALAIIFRSFFMDNILRPVALIFWLVWRLISSVNQNFYWGMVIAVCLFLVIRLLPPESPQIQGDSEKDQPKTVNGYFSWLSAFAGALSSLPELENLKEKLVDLFVSVVHQTDRVASKEAKELFKSGQFPISESGRSFLSSETGFRRTLLYTLKLRSALFMIALLKRKGSKIPKIIHQPIDEFLSLMEEKAEIKHGNQYFENRRHR